MPHNLCYKAGSLVALGGGLDQVMPRVCSGFYQLKENMVLRLALAWHPFHNTSQPSPNFPLTHKHLSFCVKD